MSLPPEPKDLPRGFLYEMAFLVDRGVRPLALVSASFSGDIAANDAAMKEGCEGLDVVAFSVMVPDGPFEYLYAKSEIIANAYTALMVASGLHAGDVHVLRGMLLGYSPAAIEDWFDEEVAGQ